MRNWGTPTSLSHLEPNRIFFDLHRFCPFPPSCLEVSHLFHAMRLIHCWLMISYPVFNFLNTFHPDLNMDQQISQWHQLQWMLKCLMDCWLIGGFIRFISWRHSINGLVWGKIDRTHLFFHWENPMVSYRFPLRSALGLWWSVAADFVPRPNSMPSEGIEFKVAFDGPRINWVLAKLVYSVLSSVSVFPLNVWLWIWKNHLRDRPLCRSS